MDADPQAAFPWPVRLARPWDLTSHDVSAVPAVWTHSRSHPSLQGRGRCHFAGGADPPAGGRIALCCRAFLTHPQRQRHRKSMLKTAKTPFKLIECPRDAWQGLPKPIPAEVKADYLRLLIAAGFRHIDAVS